MFCLRSRKSPKPFFIWVAIVSAFTIGSVWATGEKTDPKGAAARDTKAFVRNRKFVIVTDKGIPLRPLAICACKNDLYFLCPQSVWKVSDGLNKLAGRNQPKQNPATPATPATKDQSSEEATRIAIERNLLRCTQVIAIGTKIGQKPNDIPIHEFSAFTFMPEEKVLFVLDKSGDILQFDTTTGSWKVAMRAGYLKASPDPDLIDACPIFNSVAFLDPESRHVWRLAQAPTQIDQTLKLEQAGSHPSLASATNFAFDQAMYISWRNGYLQSNTPVAKAEKTLRVRKKRNKSQTQKKPVENKSAKAAKPKRQELSLAAALPTRMLWRPPQLLHTSRLFISSPGFSFLVEPDKNRVLFLDKEETKLSQFSFSSSSNLRGMILDKEGFWIINGSSLERRNLDQKESFFPRAKMRKLDPRLAQLALPMKKVHLPYNFGALPGTRRPYRYGVHEGIDFFVDSACQTKVDVGSEVRASASGKVVRADTNFQEMSRTKYLQVLSQCRREHATSAANEDLFRGQQVWIDHGGGCMTRYAHLSKIKDGITKGSSVKKGDLIAYVGVSGTRGAYPGQSKHPHLHFEIWLEGKYLGFGMTPQETLFVLEDIFGCGCK
jgi:murein DD-endopeptidase MepM/ murein hydrolase activator NlpD